MVPPIANVASSSRTSSYPRLAFALDMGAVVAGVAGIAFFWKSSTVRNRSDDSVSTA